MKKEVLKLHISLELNEEKSIMTMMMVIVVWKKWSHIPQKY